MENVQHHIHTHISKSKKGEKREQATSKLVKCVRCDAMIRARGLHSHMRQAHQVVIEKVTKVIDSPTIVKTSADYSQPDSHDYSQPASGGYSQTVKVIEEITTYKKVELVPGSRGGKIKRFSNCYRCSKPVELKMDNPNDYSDPWDVKQRIVCEPCIKAYYEENSERAHYVKDAYGNNVFSRKIN